ncbi:MAG: hypothetical protein IH872_03685 [Chloroflexi bacterium]|nr:hypothetical protein [Chloroflexota bacterium]
MDQDSIEKLLISDWASGLRITTVPQAMRRLGFADDPEQRWEMANRMDDRWHRTLETPEKVQEVGLAIGLITEGDQADLSQHWRDQVGSWDRASILLTDNEKLMARQILYRQKSDSSLPSPEDIAAAIGAGTDETVNGIRMLTRLDFLTLPDGQSVDSYALAEDHGRFLDGLGFSFHTVTLDGDEQFGIP